MNALLVYTGSTLVIMTKTKQKQKQTKKEEKSLSPLIRKSILIVKFAVNLHICDVSSKTFVSKGCMLLLRYASLFSAVQVSSSPYDIIKCRYLLKVNCANVTVLSPCPWEREFFRRSPAFYYYAAVMRYQHISIQPTIRPSLTDGQPRGL